jgi:hypothetical protein
MFIVSSMEKTDPGMAYRIFDPDVIVTRSQSDDPRYYHTRWNHYPTQDPSDDVCRMDQRNGNGKPRLRLSTEPLLWVLRQKKQVGLIFTCSEVRCWGGLFSAQE